MLQSKRTLAVGDIHGCIMALDAVLEAADVKPSDLLVFLGDYIDRGPESKEVITRLLEYSPRENVVFLRGNHEAMILEARVDVLKSRLWCSYGGDETLQFYGAGYREDWQDFIPAAHWRFFRETQRWFETDVCIFVHANLAPDVEMVDQPEYLLLWEHFTKQVRHMSGKKVICGHTPQHSGRPLVSPHAVCIDTGACGGGWLTCLDVNSRDFWQAREDGSTRHARL